MSNSYVFRFMELDKRLRRLQACYLCILIFENL